MFEKKTSTPKVTRTVYLMWSKKPVMWTAKQAESSLKNTLTSGGPAIAWLVLLLLLSSLILFSSTLHPLGDTPIYESYAVKMWQGLIPYRDFHIEYPPGVLPIIFVAQPIGLLIGSYALSYALIVGVFIFLVLFDVYKRWGRRQVLWLSCLLLIFGRFVFFQLDIFSAVALYFAIKSVGDHRYSHSAVLFAIATFIKGYPLVCLPAIILSLPKNKIRKYIRTLGLVLIIGVLPFIVVSPGGFWNSVNYHAGRPLGIESGPAIIGFIERLFGQTIMSASSHGSVALIFPHSQLINAISSLALLLSIALISVYLFTRKAQMQLATSCLALLMAYIILFKVGSVQFLLLPVILAPLVIDEIKQKSANSLWLRLLFIGIVEFIIVAKFSTWKTINPQMVGGLLLIVRTLLEVELLIWILRKIGLFTSKKTVLPAR